ncbi:unnamed protein product, partial [Tenebrio molitor]
LIRNFQWQSFNGNFRKTEDFSQSVKLLERHLVEIKKIE